HEARILTELEALHLQVVLRNADARPAGLVARARILRDLVQHSLVEHRVLAGHASLQLVPPADGDVHERMEIHGVARLPAAALLVKLRVRRRPGLSAERGIWPRGIRPGAPRRPGQNTARPSAEIRKQPPRSARPPGRTAPRRKRAPRSSGPAGPCSPR